MLVEDADAPLFKTWVVKRLEHISDADSDVLADYVLALVKTDDPAHVARQNCIENLQDFIGDSSSPFVNDLFDAIAAKSYDPSRPQPPKPTPQPITNAHSTQSSQPRLEDSHASNGSRKRSSREWESNDNSYSRKARHDSNRPAKLSRRGGRRGSDIRGGKLNNNNNNSSSSSSSNGRAAFFESLRALPAISVPPFDPNNPMGSLLAMQQMVSLMPGGLVGFPSTDPSQNQHGLNQNNNAQRCHDYDTKGFCERGANCPYEHGSDAFVVGSGNMEYDPTQASLLDVQPSRTGYLKSMPKDQGRAGHRGRGRGGVGSRGGRRANFSHMGPMNNKFATTIVVEQIPEDKFKEGSVRDFFGQFGHILEVDMQAYKRLAIVKFKDHNAAKAAYESPKSVFDNRFVKVYWHKSDASPKLANDLGVPSVSNQSPKADTEMVDVEQPIDPVEFSKRQSEAQRKHDEVKKQLEEQDRRRIDLDIKLKAIEAEKNKMAARLAQKTSVEKSFPKDGEGNAGAKSESQNEALKAKLAALQAEAKSLGIDPNVSVHSNGWSGYPAHSQGSYRSQPRRGGHYSSGVRGGWAGGAVKRLDNRPKTVAVAFSDGTYDDHEEAMRQWLLFNDSSEGGSAALSKHPERQDVALLAFPERYQGEVFMKAASAPDFPLAGRIELSWYKPEGIAPNVTSATVMSTKTTNGLQAESAHSTTATEKDYMYDVAGDDDY